MKHPGNGNPQHPSHSAVAAEGVPSIAKPLEPNAKDMRYVPGTANIQGGKRSNNHCAEILIRGSEIYKHKKQSEKEEAAKKEKKTGSSNKRRPGIDVPAGGS
ncbi:Protein of unknown function [Pyronema omphalodes CBS 100304]|uniref:Uncharacterized protein n=1 Tax=Pyronema omphalodes (strain CBS 100304) TaxID=1076935 RepID=U4L6F3_PYROM|nr:Protein of unknown function [Pyronema omphalodes CBS 100304]